MPPKNQKPLEVSNELLENIEKTLVKVETLINPPQSKLIREELAKLNIYCEKISEISHNLGSIFNISHCEQWTEEEIQQEKLGFK
jgi:hypothetical protein